MKVLSDESDTKAMSSLVKDPDQGTGCDGMSSPRLRCQT